MGRARATLFTDYPCASELTQGGREIIRMISVHSRFRKQRAHIIRMNTLPVDFARTSTGPQSKH